MTIQRGVGPEENADCAEIVVNGSPTMSRIFDRRDIGIDSVAGAYVIRKIRHGLLLEVVARVITCRFTHLPLITGATKHVTDYLISDDGVGRAAGVRADVL